MFSRSMFAAATAAVMIPFSVGTAHATFEHSDFSGDPMCSIGVEDQFKTFSEQIPGPYGPGDYGWTYGGLDNYNPCRDLSFVVLNAVTKESPAPKQVMLFHRGQLVGTTIEKPLQFQEVVATTDSSVTINYFYWKNPDEFAAQVTYRWDGEKVVMEGKVPQDLLDGSWAQKQQLSLPALSSGLW